MPGHVQISLLRRMPLLLVAVMVVVLVVELLIIELEIVLPFTTFLHLKLQQRCS